MADPGRDHPLEPPWRSGDAHARHLGRPLCTPQRCGCHTSSDRRRFDLTRGQTPVQTGTNRNEHTHVCARALGLADPSALLTRLVTGTPTLRSWCACWRDVAPGPTPKPVTGTCVVGGLSAFELEDAGCVDGAWSCWHGAAWFDGAVQQCGPFNGHHHGGSFVGSHTRVGLGQPGLHATGAATPGLSFRVWVEDGNVRREACDPTGNKHLRGSCASCALQGRSGAMCHVKQRYPYNLGNPLSHRVLKSTTCSTHTDHAWHAHDTYHAYHAPHTYHRVTHIMHISHIIGFLNTQPCLG